MLLQAASSGHSIPLHSAEPLCLHPWEGAPSAEPVAQAETRDVLPGLSQGFGVTGHPLGSTEPVRPYCTRISPCEELQRIFEIPSPDEESNRAESHKQSAGKGEKKGLRVPPLQSCEQARDSGNTGKGGEKRLLSSQAALNEVSELGSCQVKE